MSSINNNGNNGPYSANNDGSQANLQQLQQHEAEIQVRKKSDKAVLDSQKESQIDIIKLIGMSPQDATAEINGTPKANKFSAAGAVSSLAPPSAPKAAVTPKTQALYASMHKDVNSTLGTIQAGEAPIDWKALTPTMSATSSPAQAAKQVDSAVAAASSTIQAVGAQYAKVNSSAMTMAFLMLRAQGQQDGLNINNQMGEMQNAIRQADLNQQIKSDKEAQVKLDKAAKKQAAMKKAGPIIEAVIALVMAALTVLSAGSLTGLALVVSAMVLGFVIGGAVGGAKKGDGFDFNSAITGLSIGEMVVPVKAIMQSIIKGITEAVEKGIATALKEATERATLQATKTASSGLGKTASLTGSAALKETAKNMEKAVEKMAEKQSLKQLGRAERRATKQAEKAASGQKNTFGEAGEQFQSFVNSAGKHIQAKFAEIMPGVLKDTFSSAQKAAEVASATLKANPLIGQEKLMTILQDTLFAGQFVTNATQMGFNLQISKDNIAAQKELLAGKQWGQLAKVAQESWKNTQDFLSAMQDQHNTGINQIQQILAAKNQASTRAIANIAG